MSTIEHLAQEVPNRKVQRSEPLVREVNAKLRFQMRILEIRNSCNDQNEQDQSHSKAGNSSKAVLTEPGGPAFISPHQFIPEISEKLQHRVFPSTFQGIHDVIAQNRLVQFRNNIDQIGIRIWKAVSEKAQQLDQLGSLELGDVDGEN